MKKNNLPQIITWFASGIPRKKFFLLFKICASGWHINKNAYLFAIFFFFFLGGGGGVIYVKDNGYSH